jgi:hypothetical protein
MSISSSRSSLATAGNQLRLHWEQTRHDWKDSKANDFEERYLAPLFEALDRSGTLFDELERTLHQIRKDCE